jgi:hypothetical protein
MGATFGWPFCVSAILICTPPHLSSLILGIDPRIHNPRMDGRVKPDHDDGDVAVG